MNDTTWIKQVKEIIRKHLPSKEVRVFIFGSRAEGGNRKWSDIDVGLLGKKKIPVMLLAKIGEDLESSRIPFRIEIVDFKVVSKDFRNLALQKTIPL